MKRRMLSVLVILALLLAVLPTAVLAADTAATITVRSNASRYIVINDIPYYADRNGRLQNMDGTTATFAPGTYTLYYGPGGLTWQMDKTVASGTATVREGDSNVTATLTSQRFSRFGDGSGGISSAQRQIAKSIYYNTGNFDHIHLRVEGSYVIQVGSATYTARVSNPKMVVNVNGRQAVSHTWSSTTNYEWTYNCNIARSSHIEVVLTLDLTYTDGSGKQVVMEDVTVAYNNADHLDKFIEAIAICDAIQGLDFTVAVQDIEEVITYHTVTYQWKVYGPNGELMELPAGAPLPPAPSSGHAAEDQYIYDTEYVTGTSFYDYDNGLLYSFHGWDTYSNYSEFNVNPNARGMNPLDDGDTVAENNLAVPIVADTYINGYWTVSELPPAPAYIVIDKVFAGEAAAIAAAQGMWLRIDTGYDGDGDGQTTVDVDYTQLLAAKQAASGEYRLPVYQYDTPFVITEYDAEVPGYTRSTSIAVTGANASGTASGDAVTVTLSPEYQGENVLLGTVTYTNTYTKLLGEPVSSWPSLTLMKSAADTGSFQDGVEFTLYADAACTQALATLTTANGGLAHLNFADISGIQAGTYYLKETKALPGYHLDEHSFALTLTAGQSAEELRDGKFVTVTDYSLSVAVPEGCEAIFNPTLQRLHVVNAPIVGSLRLSKQATGLQTGDLADMSAVIIVHGPITRDGANAITGIGETYQVTLSQDNGWTQELTDLPLGDYLIHESLASLHGYTWTGVTYGDLETTLYNGINSAVLTVADDSALQLQITNAYDEWTAGDFYIKKVNEAGAALPGATFQIFQMGEEGLMTLADEGFTVTATTGADGYAHFTGFTVPEGQEVATYYLRETKAPAGYYLSDTLYKVELKAVAEGDGTSYEPKISVQAPGGAWEAAENFDNLSDLLTVTNLPVLGKLTLVKSFAGGTVPQGLTAVTLQVAGPEGFARTVELSAANSWSATLTDLPLGTYTVTEQAAEAAGYDLAVTYTVGETSSGTNAVITLAEADPGLTAPGADISAAATVTNAYTRREQTIEIPAQLTIRKVAMDGTTPLAGAVFTLDRLNTDGSSLQKISFTSNDQGIVVFDLLSGFIQEGQSLDGTYLLSETKAPEGYAKTDITWTVTVREDDGQLRVELNETKNLFENFWDWIVGGVTGEDASAWSFAEGILSVKNVKLIDELTVTKTWVASEGVTHPEKVEAVLYKDGKEFEKVTLNAENDWTHTWTGLTEANVWTVDEPAVPEGYTKTVAREGYDFTITNTKLFRNIDISVRKAWEGGTEHPEAVEAVLYRDGKEFKTVTLNAENDWTHTWTGLTDEFTWTVDEPAVPEGYTKTVASEGYDFTITNAKIFKDIQVSVQKIWYGAGITHPTSVDVVLYKDGEAFEKVTLNAEMGWGYTWTGLTDEFQWTVDEPSVPSGYNKQVVRSGNSFTITNTHQDTPTTGDMSDFFLWSVMLTTGLLGAAWMLWLLADPRKKEHKR